MQIERYKECLLFFDFTDIKFYQIYLLIKTVDENNLGFYMRIRYHCVFGGNREDIHMGWVIIKINIYIYQEATKTGTF